MKYVTEPVAIEGYDTWRGDRDEQGVREPMTYGDGQPVEFVKFRGNGDARYRRLTLAKTINGDRPAEGELCSLVVEDVLEPDARTNRNGEAYVAYKEKRKVIGFEPPVSAAA